MILSFGFFSGFADNASIGTMFVRQLDLSAVLWERGAPIPTAIAAQLDQP